MQYYIPKSSLPWFIGAAIMFILPLYHLKPITVECLQLDSKQIVSSNFLKLVAKQIMYCMPRVCSYTVKPHPTDIFNIHGVPTGVPWDPGNKLL